MSDRNLWIKTRDGISRRVDRTVSHYSAVLRGLNGALAPSQGGQEERRSRKRGFRRLNRPRLATAKAKEPKGKVAAVGI